MKIVGPDLDKIVDNAKQMTASIAAFKEGRIVYKNRDGRPIDPSGITKIYAVALIIASVPRFWAFNNLISERLQEKGYLPDTQPFEVLSAEDFDLLMRIVRAGCRVSDVLQRKLSHPLPIARGSSLKNFLAIYDDGLGEKANAVAWPGLGDAWYEDVAGTVRSWGLPV